MCHLRKNNLIEKLQEIKSSEYGFVDTHDGEPGQLLERILTGGIVGSYDRDIYIDNTPYEIKSFRKESTAVTICKKVGDCKDDVIKYAIEKMQNLILVRYDTRVSSKIKYPNFFEFKKLNEKKFRKSITCRKSKSAGHWHIQVSNASKLIECYEHGEELK
tara:strand:- start:3155 stop:3634 length:480 start_codon:yes stop_codon:yes gene_type:complete